MKLKSTAMVLFLVAVLSITSCRTANIGEIRPISIDNKLSLKEIGYAILCGIDPGIKKKYQWQNPSLLITNNFVSFDPGGFAKASGRDWLVEKVEENKITAGLHNGRTYLQVNVFYDSEKFWIEFGETRNLSFDGNSIHKRALQWRNNLEYRIKRELNEKLTDKIRSTPT